MLAKVLAEAKSPQRDCAKLIAPWTRVLLALVRPPPPAVKQDLESYLWLARCAEKQRYHVLLGEIGSNMLMADPKKGHPELLARALLGLNSPHMALKVLEKSDSKDADVALTKAKVQCRMRDWKGCRQSAEATAKLAAKLKGDEQRAILNRAHKYRARSMLHLGDVAGATKAVAQSEKLGGDAEDLDEVRKALVPAKMHQAIVEVEHQPIVALGIYHLIGKREGSKPLARVFIDNVGADRQFRIEATITGVTNTLSKTETVLKGKSAVIDLTPQLANAFNPASVRTQRSAELNIRVSAVSGGGEAVVHQDVEPIDLQPRDFLPTAAFVDEERAAADRLFMYMAAWVTPNAKAVESFLAEAKTRAPRHTFAGAQAATLPQIQAIYDTLKQKGVSYVMNPETLSGTGFGQRARLPSDVLSSTNAQCLEGALLYATMIEAIGLEPAIVLVPGHAFVAWRSSAYDGEELKDKALFLETTMTHDASFEDAVKVGAREFDEAAKANKAILLKVGELRRMGIAPQPYD